MKARSTGSRCTSDEAAGNPRYFQQVVDEPDEVRDLALHDRGDAKRQRILLSGGFEQLHRGHQRRQRVPQLVAERCQELVLAMIGEAKCRFGARALGEVLANLVLTRAGPQRRAHRGHERRHPERPLEQGHVAQRPDGVSGLGGIGARPRQDQHRQIGPGWLRRECRVQRRVMGGGRFFLREEDRAGTRRQLAEQVVERPADVDTDAQRCQSRSRGCRIPGRRGEKQHPSVGVGGQPGHTSSRSRAAGLDASS
jgi:hypothetical protein